MSLLIHISSFGYNKSGIPIDTFGHGGGFVFDCRALPNPGRESRYFDKSGTDIEVVEYFSDKPEVEQFLFHCLALCRLTAENYRLRGFTRLSVAYGCTGGQHRSVYCAEKTAVALRDTGFDVIIMHYEKEKWP